MTATRLVLKLMSGLQLTVDGAPVNLSKTITYNGMMYTAMSRTLFPLSAIRMRPGR